MSFGELLKRYRHVAGLSQAELAERAHMSRESVSAFERGLHQPRRDTVQMLADALGLAPDDRATFERAARQNRFPPTPLSPKTSFPQPLTSLIGREHEIANGARLIAQERARCVTLIGPAGVGKTRLALAIATELISTFENDIWMIDLSSQMDATHIPQMVMAALGLRDSASPQQASLLDHLRQRTRSLLLIWDNCEHLVDDCASLIQDLLQACPALSVLITSRQALRVPGEIIIVVAALSLPNLQAQMSEHDLLQHDAVRLFLDRAQMHLGNAPLALPESVAQAIATICCRLDGIPLAIELAAARVRTLTVEQIAGRLDASLTLLSNGSRATPSHHQTLRATLDWSYSLLTAQEQISFRRLAVFAGSFTLEAVEAVCVGENMVALAIMPIFLDLVEKSLVVVESAGAHMRYRLLDTIQQYAQELFDASEEATEIRRHHCAWYSELADASESGLRGPEQQEWLARLDHDSENLRQALQWTYDRCESATGLRMAGALWFYWFMRGQLIEGCRWLERALTLDAEQEQGLPTPARVKVLNSLGALYTERGLYGQATAIADESIADCQTINDERGYATALNLRGTLARYQGDVRTAATSYEQALLLRRAQGDVNGIATLLTNLGTIAVDQWQLTQATAYFEESLAIKQQQGDKLGISRMLNNLADVAHLQGQLPRAQHLANDCLKLSRELADTRGIAFALSILGGVAAKQGNLDRAYVLHYRSIQLFREIDNPRGIASSHRRLGNIETQRGNYARAMEHHRQSLHIYATEYDAFSIELSVRAVADVALACGVYGDATALFAASSAVRLSAKIQLTESKQSMLDQQMTTLREAMSADDFEEHWQHGCALTPTETIMLAIQFRVN